ncbi:MAG TPA: hypothetical protein DCQ33_14960 [Nitrospira sp.]|jgi:hypothetical protein|nr:hypothetical protein [Nitrospira sp.]
MADAIDEFKAVPKSKSILGMVGASALNALGGLAAGRVRGVLAGAAPGYKGAGTIGVFLVSVALRWYAKSETGYDRVIKEIAAGMAGFVGNDMWLIARALVGWGKWKPETAYASGDTVIYNNLFYRADKDIPFPPQAEPGKDSRWVRFETAQGYGQDEVGAFAQALMSNDALMDGIIKEQLLVFGPELAQTTGRDYTQEEADRIYAGMRDSLKSVVQKFAS